MLSHHIFIYYCGDLFESHESCENDEGHNMTSLLTKLTSTVNLTSCPMNVCQPSGATP
jgi:hypothetical protein